MIALDTNVVVRYLTHDDPEQAQIASLEIDRGAKAGTPFFLCSIVMCELVWVLSGAYSFHRSDIADTVEKMLRTAQFRFESKDQLWQALADYRKGRAGFADYLIGRLAKAAGCEETLSFDRSLASAKGFRNL